MIGFIHNWFNGISAREKFLLTAFLWVLILIWASNVRHKQQAYTDHARSVRVALTEQDLWFQESPQIDARIQAAKARLQSQPSYNGGELAGQIDGFVRELGLNGDLGAPRSQDSDVFNVHSVKLRLRHATLEQLICFDNKLRGKSPYLSLESISLRPDSSDPMYVDAQLSIQSLELKRSL